MVLKEGDKVRISSIGKDYRVKWIGDRMVVLETEDRTSQFLTTIDNVRPLFASQSWENEKQATSGRKKLMDRNV
jgi:hypothetical protein